MKGELPEVQAGFIKGRGTRDQIANIHQIIEKSSEFQENIYFCFIDYDKSFDCVDHSQLWKILNKVGIPGHFTCLLKNLYAGQEGRVRTRHRTMDWFRIGKEVKPAYSHLAYLTFMQRTSCKMPDWMKHKLESRQQGEISINSDMQMTPPLWQKAKRN